MPLTLPTIAIIGAGGNLGLRLIKRLSEAGYPVSAFDSNPEASSSGNPLVTWFDDVVAAGLSADVVVFSVPYVSEQALAEQIGDALGNRIVVSVTNPLSPELNDVVTPHDESAAEHLASVMPHARVVKALNSLSATAMDIPSTGDPVFDTFVASDDREAAHVVEEIVSAIGFRPWFAGDLILSRTLERMSALLIGVGMRYDLGGTLGWRIVQVKQNDASDV